MDPPFVWLGVFFLLATIAWAVAQRARPSPKTARLGSAKSHAPPKSSGERGSGIAFSDLTDVPSLVSDEDDLEITIVTASPPTDAPPSPGEEADASMQERDEESKAETSTVNVIYEEEADTEEITSPRARILVSAQGESDRGHRRQRNEDSLLVFPERSLFAVADGMGGYEGGQVASTLAVEVLRKAYERSIFQGKTVSETPVPRRGRELACAIQMANQAILRSAKKDPTLAHMGTTVLAARFSPNKQRVYIGHVGDSRCYRFRGRTLRQLTTDHTMRELGMRGPISAHLFQAVGISPTIQIDVVIDKPRPDDVYLLCSDGLSKMASDAQIRDILLGEVDLEAAVYTLIELANDQGGKDNVTVILVKILERASA